ncbi:MAG: ATP-binding protein, partial [Mangrovicoccus sp.]|nr:ATP-binding protein [Mangrovicoccus sp.]
RMARQLATDLAALLPARGFDLVDLRPGEPVPEAGGTVPLVLDLFGLDAAPRLPLSAPGAAGLVILAPDRFEAGPLRAVDAPAFAAAEAAAVWQAAGIAADTAAALAPRFRLTLAELQAARLEAETLEALAGGDDATPHAPPGASRFAQAVLAAGARRMGPFVTRVVSDVTLDDLVAAPGIHAQLADAIAWRRTDAKVWGEMGLPPDAGETPGLSLLFSGPPGGGKTFAARCLANALGLNLYRVDLSQVISKYIGETEKRLAQIFDEAEAGHGVLFFDEADAVFGKRSEVKDAHDRYANIEVGFLLQRLESFAGIVVLATNLRSNLDPAFSRRMQFIIDFPMPQQAERDRLWRRNLPAPDWREPDLDIGMLAERFRLAGGNIRNAAVAAAHLAAADGAKLGPRHIARALVRELEKSGLPRGTGDLGPLADWLEDAP